MISKKGLYFGLCAAVIAILAIVYFRYDPSKYGLFPKCPFYTITGYNCPGCGSQRAIYNLLHGNIRQAARFNLLLVLSLPLLAVHFFYKIKSAIQQKDIRLKLLYNPLTPKIIFVVVVIFWIARNIPAAPFSYLAANH